MRFMRWFFGAQGQLAVGILVFVVSLGAWAMGTTTIPGATGTPWEWGPSVFIFHASMFALMLAAYGIVATALGYRATERVETAVVENIENAESVEVNP